MRGCSGCTILYCVFDVEKCPCCSRARATAEVIKESLKIAALPVQLSHPIKGLYAAGEVTGGVHGGDHLGSCATLACIAFGRIAGHNVATQ